MSVNRTSIEWTDRSVNPIRARRIDNKNRVPGHFCTKKSSGCANCYSSRMQVRFGMPKFGAVTKTPADMGIEVYLDDNTLKTVLALRKPSRIFWCDMTDMFGEWVPDEWIDKCFAVMALTPQHTHQVLTKRPERMAEYMRHKDPSELAEPRDGDSTQERVAGWAESIALDQGWCHADYAAAHWPMPNVWLGTSCENQETANERIPHLLATPAAVRFLSCEPLLGPLGLTENWYTTHNWHNWLTGETGLGRTTDNFCSHEETGQKINWVIVGGESGPNARPMHPEWVRSIRDQCVAAGVPFHFKQWGAWSPFATQAGYQAGTLLPGSDEIIGGDCGGISRLGPYNNDGTVQIEKWGEKPQRRLYLSMPDHTWGREQKLIMEYVRLGKKAAGRLLDGRTWDQFPEPTTA